MGFGPTLERAGLLAVLVAWVASPVVAQVPAGSTASARGRIEGRVLLPGGHPVDRVVKLILSTARDPGTVTYTDSGGYFRYDNLAAGSYSLEAVDEGNRYDNGVERVTVNRGERATVQVHLREKRATVEKSKGEVVSSYESDQNAPPAARHEYDKAKQLMQDAKTEEAVEHLREAIKIYPGYLRAHNDLGVQYLNLGKLENASDELGVAIDIDPKAFNPRLNIGIVLIQQHKYSEALDQLTQAVSIDSSQPAGHLYLGVAWLGSDSLDGAQRELTKALELGGPPYCAAHYHLAGVYLKKGERDGAIRELESYLEGSPGGEQADHAKVLLEQLKRR